MDAAIAAGILYYEAVTSSALFWRSTLTLAGTCLLIIECMLFAQGLKRGALCLIAVCSSYIPFSSLKLPPYSSYPVIMYFGNAAFELMVALFVVTTILYFFAVRPIQYVKHQQQTVTPIAISARGSLPQTREESCARSFIPESCRKRATEKPEVPQGKRSRITRSHILASRLYAEDNDRRAAYSPSNLRTARTARIERERSALRADGNAQLANAQHHLEQCLAELRIADEEAETAIARRDAAESREADMKELTRAALEAERKRDSASNAVNAAHAVLRDVETWVATL